MNDNTGIYQAALMALIRHGVGWLGAALVAKGAVAPGDLNMFTQIGVGIAGCAISYGWSVYQKKGMLGIIADMKEMQRHLLAVNVQVPPSIPQASLINAAVIAAKRADGLAPPPPAPPGKVSGTGTINPSATQIGGQGTFSG